MHNIHVSVLGVVELLSWVLLNREFALSTFPYCDYYVTVQEVQMSSSFSRELGELLTGLLEKDPGQRLGCQGRG